MAPEALTEGRCSVQSDTWSFGVLMWEVWTYAQLPYATHTNQEVYDGVLKDLVLAQPAGCPNALYRLMKEVQLRSDLHLVQYIRCFRALSCH
jgi:hypothetical protein